MILHNLRISFCKIKNNVINTFNMLLFTVTLALFSAPAFAQNNNGSNLESEASDILSKMNIPNVVRDAKDLERAIGLVVEKTLKEKPHLVFEALREYRMQTESTKIDRLRHLDQDINITDNIYSFGPLGEDVPILLFYDYTCISCNDVAFELATMVYDMDYTRHYLLDIGSSETALERSRIISYAYNNLDKEAFEALHLSLISDEELDNKALGDLMITFGYVWEDIKEASKSASLISVRDAREASDIFDVSVLPTVIIGDRKLEGDDVTRDTIVEAILEARKSNSN